MSVKQHIRYRVEARGLDIMGLLIDNLMYTEYLPTFIDRPHMHDTWHLFYFVSGAGIISVNGVEEEVSDGHVAIIRPYNQHFFRMKGDATATSFEVKWQFSSSIKEFLAPPKWSGIFHDRYGLRLYVNQAIDELSSRQQNWELMLRSIIFGMLIQVDRALHQEMQRVGDKPPIEDTYGYRYILVQKAVQYVKDKINREVSLREVADSLCISPQYLGELFRKETGQSFAKWVIEQKMAMARDSLMSSTEKPIKEIARELGYDDPHYFSRIFKRKTGMTLTEYRLLVTR
ncbi:MAG TPA: AraC family transcriptional regulator [Firmicutes bacterium]|jgi:AraC-like DNA-binding protein/mannose-6-phosphate isomerase-like protein (cupin superfamily)|nr:AraC family transcriptional regulator [Bacillota bacterium]